MLEQLGAAELTAARQQIHELVADPQWQSGCRQLANEVADDLVEHRRVGLAVSHDGLEQLRRITQHQLSRRHKCRGIGATGVQPGGRGRPAHRCHADEKLIACPIAVGEKLRDSACTRLVRVEQLQQMFHYGCPGGSWYLLYRNYRAGVAVEVLILEKRNR